jgi:aldehyde dehydrogenase (NAD+)
LVQQVNLLMGCGSDVGATLLPDTRLSAISVTGAVTTGNKVARACLSRKAKSSST